MKRVRRCHTFVKNRMSDRKSHRIFRVRRQLECLEHRLCFSLVSWDGGGDGISWDDSLNWDSNTLPTSTDDVVIDVPGEPTVRHVAGNTVVNSITSSEILVLAGGTLTINATSSLTTLTIESGTLTSGDLSMDRLFWDGASTMTGAGTTTIRPGGELHLRNSGPGFSILDGRTLDNFGTAFKSANGQFRGENIAVVNNYGTFNINAGGKFGSSTGATFSNHGEFIKASGGETQFEWRFDNHGSVDLQQGALQLFGGGTNSGSYEAAPATSLVFGGTTNLESTSVVASDGEVRFHDRFGGGLQSISATIEGTYNVHGATVIGSGSADFTNSNLVSLGDSLTMSASVSNDCCAPFFANFGENDLAVRRVEIIGGNDSMVVVRNMSVAEELVWQGGTMTGPGTTTILPGGTAQFFGGKVEDRVVDNYGTARWFSGSLEGAVDLRGENSVINNFGTFEMESRGRLLSSITSIFSNYGLFVMTAPGTVESQWAFWNYGELRLQSGLLNFTGASFVQFAGETMLRGGQIGSVPVRPLRVDGGVLSGDGEIAGSVINRAVVAPGTTALPIGAISVFGSYTQEDSGTLSIDIGADASSDELRVSGVVQLDGQLAVTALSGAIVPMGASFVIVSNEGADAVVGEFNDSQVTLADAKFAITYTGGDGNDVQLIPIAFSMLSGNVYDDFDNDGGLDVGESGIAGVNITLSGNDANGPVNRTTHTSADGSYSFGDVLPGTYAITASQSSDLLDGKEQAGTLGGTVDNIQDSNVISQIVVPSGGLEGTDYDFAEIRPSDLQGLVWQDFNNDGQVNFGEKAIENVSIAISGTDDRSNAVNLSALTDIDGVYMFVDLRPGEYTLTETQAAGFEDGLDVAGTVNGSPMGDNSVNEVISEIVIALPGSVAVNYNFGERPAGGGGVTAGQTATIGFWQNNNGQALIESLNSGAASTQLANWLAATFDNMYGADAGPNNLTGMTNADVADFYSALFLRKKKESLELGLGGPVKMDAQVMAVAFATYVTNLNLADTVAANYGFLVTENGVGTSLFNVGDSGEAFNVADNTSLAVLDLLFATNENTRLGVLYDLDGDGDADDNWETTLRTLANDVYSVINEQGRI
jgi:hypothetical protein